MKPSEWIKKRTLKIQKDMNDEFYAYKPERRTEFSITTVEKAILDYLDSTHNPKSE